jgi:hypothetical protein
MRGDVYDVDDETLSVIIRDVMLERGFVGLVGRIRQYAKASARGSSTFQDVQRMAGMLRWLRS